jgi:NodT family efflux transporter outer membrane factor (OMF) lipoprotein
MVLGLGKVMGHRAVPAVLLALALGGCALARGSTAPPDPAIALPAKWSDSGAPKPDYDPAAYWQALNDPVLSQLVEEALKNNLDIAQSASRLASARETLRQAHAAFLPQLSASGSATRALGDGATSEITTSLGLNASWEIDLFGKLGNSANAARFDYQAAGYSLADLQRAIAGQVAQQVISARATAQQLAIARNTLKNQDDNLQIAQWRLQAGLVSSLDVEQARSQRASTAASIPLLESSLAATSNAISTLIGEPPGRVLDLLSKPAAMPTPPALSTFVAPADLLRRRPDIRGAEATLRADLARVGVARSALFPTLSLSGNIGTNDAGPVNLFDVVAGSVMGSITQLLFDGGRTSSRIRQAKDAADGALAAWRKSILTGLEETESAIAARKSADARLGDLTEGLNAAQNAELLARSQYQAGLTDFQTLLTSESSLLAARNSLVSAEADRATAFVRLTQALGGGWSPQDFDDRTSQ